MASDASASPDGGVFVETILPDEEDASVLTDGSSVGSATVDFADGPSFHDLVDLRGNNWCRIVMRAGIALAEAALIAALFLWLYLCQVLEKKGLARVRS